MRLKTPSLTSLQRESFVLRMVAGVIAVSLLVGLMVVVVLAQSYRLHQEQAVVTAENLSWVLEQNITGSVNLINQAQLTVSDEATRQLAAGGIDFASFNAFILRQDARLTNADGVHATNAAGQTLYGSRVSPTSTIVGRDYFNTLRDDPNAGLVMSKSLVGRISGKWAVVFARRLNHPDGGFAGVVFSSVNLESFAKMFSAINVGPHGVVSLFDGDATLLARYPDSSGPGGGVGKKINSSKLLERLSSNDLLSTYRAHSGVDGIDRIFSNRKVTGHSLYVAVGLAQEDIQAGWWTDAMTLIGVWGLFTILLSVVAVLLVKGWRHRLAALKTMEENAELEAKVADRTRDLEESNRKLSALSATDGLTGIANRRRFDETYAHEWNRAVRTGQPLALVLFDVDLFKNYNDHYGHLKGDDCLRKVAQLLNGHARRSGDLVARYGGEEFAFMAPAMDASSILALTETIRKALEALEMPHDMSPLGRVTVSAGIAVRVPVIGDAPDLLVTLADQALYRAKREGRNRSVLAEQITARAEATTD